MSPLRAELLLEIRTALAVLPIIADDVRHQVTEAGSSYVTEAALQNQLTESYISTCESSNVSTKSCALELLDPVRNVLPVAADEIGTWRISVKDATNEI